MLTYAGAGSCNRMRNDSAGAYTDYTDAYNYTLYTAPLQVPREHSIAAYARMPATPKTPPPLLPRSRSLSHSEWMRLTDAQVSLVEAAYKARLGKVSEVFIPVRPVGEPTDVPVHILLSTDDRAVVAALQHLSQSGGTKEKKVASATRQADRLFMRQDIIGLTRYGFFYDALMRARLARLNMNLAEDFVILDDGAAPNFWVNLCMVGGGLLIWFFMLCHEMRNALWRWRRRRAFYRQRSME